MKKKILVLTMITLCLCTSNVFAATLPIRYNGKNYNYSGSQLNFTYKSTKVSIKNTPGIQINNTNMIPYYLTLVKKGPKIKRSYNSKTGKLTLKNGSKKIIFYKNKKYAYTNGTKRSLTAAPVTVKYRNVNKSYILVPAKFTAKYLGYSYTYDKSSKTVFYNKTQEATTATTATTSATTTTTTVSNTTTDYKTTLSKYISLQKAQLKTYNGKTIDYNSYIPTSTDTTHKYQFLRLNTYRDVNTTTYNNLLTNNTNSSSVLRGKGSTLISAAKSYNIDPVYFLCQTILETGYGTSTLSQGKSVTKVITGDSVVKTNGVVTGFKKVNGKYITKSISSTKVYNLYGIKAYDDDPQLCGFSYAYYMGWTSVNKAITGAAKYVSEEYINNSTYKQNTLYKFRYNPNTTYLWHQYATDPAYATKIASLMYTTYRSAYSSGVTYTYDLPSFR